MTSKFRDYFTGKLKEQKCTFLKQESVPSNALLASYKVAYKVAKCTKSHTIAEELILPDAMDIVSIMVGESSKRLISKLPFCNNTISRRIQHMAEDLNDQLIQKIKGKEFGLQLDEATDSNKIVEYLPFCKGITASTKTQGLFKILVIFVCENNLNLTKCIGVCTDGGHSISGCYG
ncbi:protein FAM200C-like [Tachypleus tridentatus]|uniref:protein FAM200C-like n=1 Tax=Tachypleus tridentatus TaxID=6853 RepID=UPI003FD27928